MDLLNLVDVVKESIVWGLVSAESRHGESISMIRRRWLYLPGWVDTMMLSSSGVKFGGNFPAAES
jgi:hypothetical protein